MIWMTDISSSCSLLWVIIVQSKNRRAESTFVSMNSTLSWCLHWLHRLLSVKVLKHLYIVDFTAALLISTSHMFGGWATVCVFVMSKWACVSSVCMRHATGRILKTHRDLFVSDILPYDLIPVWLCWVSFKQTDISLWLQTWRCCSVSSTVTPDWWPSDLIGSHWTLLIWWVLNRQSQYRTQAKLSWSKASGAGTRQWKLTKLTDSQWRSQMCNAPTRWLPDLLFWWFAWEKISEVWWASDKSPDGTLSSRNMQPLLWSPGD